MRRGFVERESGFWAKVAQVKNRRRPRKRGVEIVFMLVQVNPKIVNVTEVNLLSSKYFEERSLHTCFGSNTMLLSARSQSCNLC
jgi:hypothetical protein